MQKSKDSVDVLLIHPPYHRRAGSGVIPPIGLAYVASALESSGYTVKVLDCCLDCGSQSPAGLNQFRAFLNTKLSDMPIPRCVGVGPATTPALKSMKVLSETLDFIFPGVPTVYGGPFASMSDQAPVFFDILGATAVLRGEAEDVISDLVQTLLRGERGRHIPGVAWADSPLTPVTIVQDVNALAFPARHLLQNGRYRPSLRRNVFDGTVTALFLSRGCPYSCSFCVSPLLRGRRVARRDLSNLYVEMRQCIRDFGISGFIFYDDCLFLKSRKLNEQVQGFCTSLVQEVGDVKWEMELRCDAVAALSVESLLALQTAGCAQINMGIEKASDQHLKDMNKRLTTDQIESACRNVHSISPGIRLAGTFILGGPNEDKDDIRELVRFSQSLDLDFAHFYPLEVYPGTPFFTEVNGDKSPVEWAHSMLADERNSWGEIIYETEALSAERLLELTQWAYRSFYQRPEWFDRFQSTTSPDVVSKGLKVVDRWCEDRFHLTSEETDDVELLA